MKRRIYLEPRFLDSNIKEHLLSVIIQRTFEECTEEHGHILSIKSIKSFTCVEGTIFNVEFEAETLKPEAGKKIRGRVCMINSDCILIEAHDRQKLLIPSMNLKEYEFDQVSRSWKKEKINIEEGDDVDAIVTAAKFSNKNFSCFGSLA